MSDVHTGAQHWHPVHTLVSWPAVIAGAIVAVAIGAMLNLLGVALGAAAVNPYSFDGGDAEGFSAAAGLWMAVANAVALFIGAAVASRAAKFADHHKGALHGLSVWALAFVLAIVIASIGAAQTTAAVADQATDEFSEPQTGPADIIARDARTGEPVVVVPQDARDAADEAADTTATLALWGFLAMLLGAVAAIFGGMYGTRNHRWLARTGVTEGATDTLPPRV